MNTNQLPIRGNICSCGQVWFCLDIPESDPDRCPYCSRQIDSGEIYGEEDVHQQTVDGVLPEEVSKNLGKATGDTPIRLVSKICNFCTNELFFDAVDAPNAVHCPYCDGVLVDTEEVLNVMDDNTSKSLDAMSDLTDELSEILGGNMGELVDERISVKFHSLNPFAKEKTCVFKGIDLTNMHVKLLVEEDSSLIWVSLNEIKRITVIGK